MTVELARRVAMPRPWGVTELGPWLKTGDQETGDHGGPVGEIWYERPPAIAPEPALLLKLLFSSQPLSIQVHPDDTHARSVGLANGKTEAWYVVSAAPGAAIALGLKQQLSKPQLRQAIVDGSIAGLVAWNEVVAGDVAYVPAGMIHAIGTGLVIAEIQQRSDATYRLFDHGRQRALHVEEAMAVADTGPAKVLVEPTRLTQQRTILARGPYFVFERLEFAADSTWSLNAEPETWLLVLSGDAIAGPFGLRQGDGIFVRSDQLDIRVGLHGMVALAAYASDQPLPDLLQPHAAHQLPDAPIGADQLPLPNVSPATKRAPTERQSGFVQ